MQKDCFAIFKVKVTAEGSYDQNMTVSAMSSELLIFLLLNLVWEHITMSQIFIWRNRVVQQWVAAHTEIKVPPGENTELKCSPSKAWSRSVYSHTCYTCCQGFLPWLFLPFRSIHLHCWQNLSWFFPVLAVANTGSCAGPQATLLDAGPRVECPQNIKKHDLWYDDLWNESLGDRVKFVFSPDVIHCGWLGSKYQLTN